MEVKVKATTMIPTKTVDDETKNIKDEEDEKNIIKLQEGDSVKKITEKPPHRSIIHSTSSSSSSSSSPSSSSLSQIMKMLPNEKSCNKREENKKKEEEKKKENNNNKMKKTSSVVWDCGSSLYDSFELNSFKRQLDSAITASSARTMSMSRLPDRRPAIISPPPQTTSFSTSKKQSNKISRSLQRMLKSVFRSKSHHTSSVPSSPSPTRGRDMDRYYVVYDKTGSLTTIPESTEKEVGPEINSLVRKTVSERFPAARVVGISCA